MLSVLPSSAVSTVLEGQRGACWTQCLEALGRRDTDLHREEEASLPASGLPGACPGAVLAKLGPGRLPHVGNGQHDFLLYHRAQNVHGLLIDQRLQNTRGMGCGGHQKPALCPCSILPVPVLSTQGAGGPRPHFQPAAHLLTWTFSASWFSRQKASKSSDASLHLHSVQMLLRNSIFCWSCW